MGEIEKGTILADTYEIVDIIGSGGGGITYKARHLRLQTDVVVKKIRNEIVHKVNTRSEADILKKLKHAYLPRIYDFIETEDGVYTVIDYIPGLNLDEAVKKHGAFDQKLVLKWANQLAEALSYLHSQNPPIIHSDIKPANIMLTNEGDVCLIDFNISLALGQEDTASVGVSPGFSPPEQFKSIDSYVQLVMNYTGSCNLLKNQSIKQTLQTHRNEDMSNSISGESECEETELLIPENSVTEIIETELIGGDNDNTTEIIGKEVNEAQKGQYEYTLDMGEHSQYTLPMGRGIDARSDIYSLGMTLVYLLTSAKSSCDYVNRVTLDDTHIDISEGLGTIIRKMINYDPNARYSDGTELLRAFRNIHKLDNRYKNVHRVQNILQTLSLGLFILGSGMVLYGAIAGKNEKNGIYNHYVDEAEKYIESGDYAEADELIEEAIEIDSERGDAYKEKVYLLYSSGEYEAAIDNGTAYVNSPTMKAWIQGKVEKKLQANAQSIGDIFYLVGNSYFELGQYSRAVEYLEQALEFNSTNGLFYRDYAIALARLGENGLAVEKLTEAENLGLADDSVYLTKGQIAFLNGQYQESIDYFEKSISHAESEQTLKRAIFLCSDAYSAMGIERVDDNIELLLKYKDSLGKNGGLMIKEYLANAYMTKAEEDASYNQAALEQFEDIIATGYSSFQIEENIAILHGNMGEYDKAIEVLTDLADRYPGNYEIYKDMAYIEIYSQSAKDIIDRDYHQFKIFYDQAKTLCNNADDEMEMLERIQQELISGGWELE